MKPNWSLLVTKAGTPPKEQAVFEEKEMESRIHTIQKKWENRNPDSEVSVVNREGDLIYMGRYFEGVVIRVNGNNEHTTFLTAEMAKQFGEWLVGTKTE